MIDSFSGKYGFLSNFYYHELIFYDGFYYPTVEHAFQASKTLDYNKRLEISIANSPSRAKYIGRSLYLRHSWENIKIDIMKDLLIKKFGIHELHKKLIATDNKHLVEGNTWGDHFWGVCKGTGDNVLGRLLMEIRNYYISYKNDNLQNYILDNI